MSPVKFVKEGLNSGSELPVNQFDDASLTQEKIPLQSELPKMGPPNVSTLPAENLKMAAQGSARNTSDSDLNTDSFEEGNESKCKKAKLCPSAKEDGEMKEPPNESLTPNKTKRNPKTAWSKSKKIIRCLLCQEKGHGLKDCPKSNLAPCCHKCGASDHFARACSIKEDIQTFAVCFICNEKGHLGKSCPTKSQVQQSAPSQAAVNSDAASPVPTAVERKPVNKEKKEKRDTMNSKQVARRNELRFKKIREELNASGKSPEEIEREFMGVQRAILKKAFFIRCHLCQERGHGQKDCPKSQGVLVCHKCGQSGHFSKDCAIKGAAHTFAVCFLCRQMGHLGKFCPNNPAGRMGPCYTCNETTHLQKDCPFSQNVPRTIGEA